MQDVKSQGIRSQIYGIKIPRIHHLLSSIESELFYLAEFSNRVIDIREQFPILPLNYTQKIAKTIGVEHPTHPKTQEPIIITTDLLLTIQTPEGIRYQAISVKPETETSKLRVLEKIDIERVCWELMGVQFRYFTGNKLTQEQSRNISWATAPFREKPASFTEDQIDFALSEIKPGQSFINDICSRYVSIDIASHETALDIIRHLISEKLIEVDMSYNILESGLIDISKTNTERTIKESAV